MHRSCHQSLFCSSPLSSQRSCRLDYTYAILYKIQMFWKRSHTSTCTVGLLSLMRRVLKLISLIEFRGLDLKVSLEFAAMQPVFVHYSTTISRAHTWDRTHSVYPWHFKLAQRSLHFCYMFGSLWQYHAVIYIKITAGDIYLQLKAACTWSKRISGADFGSC